MDVDQMIELEVIARDLVAELETAIADNDQEGPPGKLDGTEGRLSRQDSMLHHEMAKDAQRRRRERLAALQAALERMDHGSYGSCANCGAEIPYERLQAQPEAQICGHCSS